MYLSRKIINLFMKILLTLPMMSVSNVNAAFADTSINSGWWFIALIFLISFGLVLFFWIKVDKLRLTTKMFSLVTILLSLIIIISAEGIIAMQQIGTELVEIAEEDIPLTEAITKITVHQLEQSIMLERAALASGAMTRDEKKFNYAKSEFNRLASLVDEEIKLAEKLAEHGLANITNKTSLAEYQNILEQLIIIEKEHKDFDQHGAQMLEELRLGQNAEAQYLLNSIEAEEDQLNHHLKTLEDEIITFTQNSALMAEYHEQSSIKTMSYISIIAIALGIFIGLIIVRSIIRQLGGDPEELITIAKCLAEGDLTISNKRNKSGVYGAINDTIDRLISIISGIKTGASEVAISTEQVSQGNSSLSQRTQEQASSLEEVASSMEEMTSTVNQNSENADQANQLAKTARDQAEKNGEVASQAVAAMNEISEASNQIADIIGVIDEIAFQTNLLALNAAVEAARAGEQGRGFAVVASEVRNLAGRCATAAKEIKGLIGDSVYKVEIGTKLVDQSGQALGEIVASVKKVSDIIAEIAMASKEQANGIGQVNTALLQMDEVTQQNASLVEEAAAASETMGAQAEELSASVAFFKIDSNTGNNHTQQRAIEINHQSDNGRGSGGGSKPSSNRLTRAVTSLPKNRQQDDLSDATWQEF